MEHKISLQRAQEILLPHCAPRGAEPLAIEQTYGRISARDITARENFPAFARSPFDGYAFIAADTFGASKSSPVTLKVVENVPAGKVPTVELTPGLATRIMTGAPIPVGADAITKFEITEFTADSVTLFDEFGSGKNIIPAGEDVQAGSVLVKAGTRLIPPLVGALAAQGITEVEVFKKPRVGIISTGSEVTPVEVPATPGKLRDSNRYTFDGALKALGCETVFLGLVEDDVAKIAALIDGGRELDAIVSTGGASVGDYDFINDAFDAVGAVTLATAGKFRPGGAFAFATLDNTLLLGLSGNPASALNTLYAVAAPAIRKLAGEADFGHTIIKVKLAEAVHNSQRVTRLMRGTLDLSDGTLNFVQHAQGNGMLTSWSGCDVIAIIPESAANLDAGAEVEAIRMING
jgi:molybdopterin molybdotransferase